MTSIAVSSGRSISSSAASERKGKNDYTVIYVVYICISINKSFYFVSTVYIMCSLYNISSWNALTIYI